MAPQDGGVGPLDYPLVSDLNKDISFTYGVLSEDGVALRASFLIDRQGIVRHQIVNDLPLGRDVDETLRIIDALQFYEQNGDVCPANWHQGDEAISPSPQGIADFLNKNLENSENTDRTAPLFFFAKTACLLPSRKISPILCKT